MTFQSVSRQYLANLENAFKTGEQSGETTPELSFRPAIDIFFRDLIGEIDNESIDIIFEPKKQRHAGRPDWRFYHRHNLGVFGFIEAKALDTASLLKDKGFLEQIKRYLALGQNLILTDGIDFIFYLKSNDWAPQCLSLCQKPLPSENWAALTIEPRLNAAFRQFFSSPRPRQCSEEQLIGEVALRAARLSNEIAALVALDPNAAFTESERASIEKLVSLQAFLKSNHDPILAEDKPFSDFVAQVLCFGLLYSHRAQMRDGTSSTQLYSKIHQYWLEGLSGAIAPLRPFQELVRQLRDDLEPKAGKESILSTWYDDCRHLLSYVELTDEQRAAPDFHRLYELFLEKFDPQTRFDFGAFYTPQELASFVVAVADKVALTIYAASIFENTNKIIDPCCGTGTFIEALLTRLPHENTPTIVGFEILPAPYALAHYRLSLLPSLADGNNGHVHILLTNTLSDLLDDPVESAATDTNLFQLEQIDARRHALRPIITVIGNPPSSDSTKAAHQVGTSYVKITNLVNDFRPPIENRGSRQNLQKQLRNDFVRFIRWSADRVGEQRGIIALVLPESFLEHGSYRYARKWLVENFGFIWCLDIDLDQRVAGNSTGLFNTLQGRALLIAARNDMLPKSTTEVRYGSMSHLPLAEKKRRLNAFSEMVNLNEIFPTPLELDLLHSFRPPGIYNKGLWLKSWPIYASGAQSTLAPGSHSIFVRHASALKLGATSLLVHADQALLKRRTTDVGNDALSYENLHSTWFAGQSKPAQKDKVLFLRPALREAAKRNNASPYLHRPFVNLWAVLDEEVLSSLTNMPGGGARPRPEVRRAFAEPNNLAFTIAPARKDLAEDLHRFASFCWGIPDNDLCRRGNAQVVCQLFPDYKRNGKWADQPYANFDPVLLTQLPTVKGIPSSDALVYYCYAMLCSQAYLEAFSGALFTTASADSIPRLPITNSPDLFGKIVVIGRALAELENPAFVVELSATRRMLLAQFVASDMMQLSALCATPAPDGNTILMLTDNVGNPLFSSDPIEEELANFKVSGYSVLKEWVKWHSFKYTRIPLRKNTIEAFLGVITRIEQQIALLPTLNEMVEAVLDSPPTWIDCPTSEEG